MTQLELRLDERMLFCGKTGSGKSALAKYLLEQAQKLLHARIIIIDADDSFSKKKSYLGLGTVEAPVKVKAYARFADVQLYVPDGMAKDDSIVNEIFEHALEDGDCIVYIDEAMGLVTQNSYSREFSNLWTRGRKHHTAAWIATQRPMRVPEIILSQAEHAFIFRINHLDDRKRLVEYMDIPEILAEPVEKYYFWYKHSDAKHAVLQAPLNIGRYGSS